MDTPKDLRVLQAVAQQISDEKIALRPCADYSFMDRDIKTGRVKLPTLEETFGAGGKELDIRTVDCSQMDLSGYNPEKFTFDNRTIFPDASHLPEGFDPQEIIPWARTFICRITFFDCSEKYIVRRFFADIRKMNRLYTEEDEEIEEETDAVQ